MTIPATTRQYHFPKIIGSYQNLELQEVPVPPPKANEVLVKTHAVSLQFRDLMIAKGVYPGEIQGNLVPCSDMAGEIIALGEEVTDWKVGDRVCPNFLQDKLFDNSPGLKGLGGPGVQGVLTQYRSFPGNSLVEIPEHLSYEEASTLPCAAVTAYNALLSGISPLKAGDTVLVLGTGGVSIFALQFAVASGAIAIVTSSSDDKLAVATKLGAKHVINYKKTPNWGDEVLELTKGVGVDHVIEVSGHTTLPQSASCVRRGGIIDLIGAVAAGTGGPPADILWPCILKAINLRGISIGSVVQFKNMNKLISANVDATRPVIDKVFEFEETKAAYGHLESQMHVGKVVIKL
ncbi:alcohol dehydrogenase superfamily protein [Favolaschia claudopus]|uniref:Alcohol dehydrogenase superfamily protein n=1 Tax=Favolaschia claudopus TaxID=2862362 RepID=A0AAW0BDF1_9AGAR